MEIIVGMFIVVAVTLFVLGLFGQFDNDESFEIMSGFGKEITLKMQPDNVTIEFTCTESGKRFKMFVKHCH